MKKILVYGLTNNMGGLEMFIAKTILNMDTTDIEIHALIYEKVIFYEQLREKGVIFHDIVRRGKNPIKNLKMLNEIFLNNKFDAIWLNACTLTYISPLVLAKKHGVKVRAIHGHSTDITRGNLMRFFHSINKKRIGKYANLFMGCTPEAAMFVAPKSIIKDRNFIVVKNAIELEKYSYSKKIREEVRREFDIESDDFVIGNVGHLIDVKNQDFLIDIFEEINRDVPNSKLIIVGEGELEQDLKEKAINKSIKDKIIFTGKRNDVNRIMNAFDVFVMPSKFEGLPLSAVEAQASGLKTFLSDKVSKDSKLTDLVYFINLDSDIINWKNFIISNALNYTRNSKTDILKAQGFSIKENAKYIKQLLCNSVEER